MTFLLLLLTWQIFYGSHRISFSKILCTFLTGKMLISLLN